MRAAGGKCVDGVEREWLERHGGQVRNAAVLFDLDIEVVPRFYIYAWKVVVKPSRIAKTEYDSDQQRLAYSADLGISIRPNTRLGGGVLDSATIWLMVASSTFTYADELGRVRSQCCGRDTSDLETRGWRRSP